jgi:hypothetical protein
VAAPRLGPNAATSRTTAVVLVRALDDILHFQATLCPRGDAKTLSVEEIQGRISRVAKTVPRSYLV